jgi:hypothetical protein
MNRVINRACIFLISLGIITLTGCGGGGGGGGGGGTPQPTKAVIVFSTTLPVGSSEQIGSVDLSFELPPGITLPATVIPVGPSGSLNFSGTGASFAALPTANAQIIGSYTPAIATAKAIVKLTVISLTSAGQGMNPGEFATLVCNLTPGVIIDLAAIKSTGVLIGNATGVKLYDTLGGVTGPAGAAYKITLLYDPPSTLTGASSNGTF